LGETNGARDGSGRFCLKEEQLPLSEAVREEVDDWEGSFERDEFGEEERMIHSREGRGNVKLCDDEGFSI
jgi:hypothetical protein